MKERLKARNGTSCFAASHLGLFYLPISYNQRTNGPVNTNLISGPSIRTKHTFLYISHFGFKSGILLLIAPFAVHSFSIIKTKHE